MGSALKVSLPSTPKKGSTVSVKIAYTTSKDCTALGWLTKEYVSRCLLQPMVALTCLAIGRRKARRSLTYSANASLSMLAPCYLAKVRAPFALNAPMLIQPQTLRRSRSYVAGAHCRSTI
jgi:hypothetical protein